jgi:ATP-dependent Clp protease protease subunit
MSIFDTMNFIKPDVSTLCIGLAASMGAFLLAAGEKGKRFSLPNSKIMIHQPLGGAGPGDGHRDPRPRDPVDARADEQDHGERTGQPLKRSRSDTERDYFMSADEAKTYGLVDQVCQAA